MSVDIDPDEFYKPDAESDTRATTAGSLPDITGGILLLLAFIGIIGIGTSFGYSPFLLALIFTAGLIAAVGVRIAATGTTSQIVAGVTLLWLSALLFTFTTVTLITSASNAIGTVFIPLTVAAAALLAPFSLLGSTIQSFGHGTGRNVLRRYLVGTLLLVVAIVLLLVGGVFQSITSAVITGVANAVTGEQLNGLGVYPQAVFAVFLYTAAWYAARHTISELPFEVFTDPGSVDRITRIREFTDTAHHYGLVAVGLYMCVVVVSFVFTRGDPHVAGEIALIITELGAATPLLFITSLWLIVTVTAIIFLRITRRATDVTGLQLAETLGPPLVIILSTSLITVPFREHVAEYLTTTAPGQALEQGGVLHQLVTGQPSIIVLALITVALLCSAFVLSIPSMFARARPGDVSLTGITAAVVAITALVVVAVLARQNFGVIVGGIVLAAVIWELGEYSTVAAGELASPGGERELPDGFTSLAAVHTVATTFVAVTAILFATIAVILLGSASITVTVAAVSLLLCSIALAAVISLLSG